jgi:heat shock protein HslJ
MKNILIVFVLLLTFGEINAQKTHLWYVADKKIACQSGDVVMACLLIKTSKDSAWKDFPHEIEGFIFEQGVEVRIEVLETLVPDSAGNLQQVYKLVSTMEERKTVIEDKRVLTSNTWKIINIQERQKQYPSKKTGAFLVFQVDSGRISGFSGCNRLSGNAQFSDGSVNFGMIASTKMGCDYNEVEQKINAALVGRAAYYVRNNILFMICENGAVLHLRPEKKLDSILLVISKPPSIFDGNTFFFEGENCPVRLDDVPEAGGVPMMFRRTALTAQEKEKILYKLVNIAPDHQVAEIHILKKNHKVHGMNYALVVFKDGSSKQVDIRQVMQR